MKRNRILPIIGLTRHQYYYKPKGTRPGNKPTETTRRRISDQIIEVSNQEVIKQIKQTKSDPDTDYGYRKMCAVLMILGYYIKLITVDK